MVPRGDNTEALHAGPSQTLPYVPLHLAGPADLYLLYKTVILRIALS